jgi:hypothetical protein
MLSVLGETRPPLSATFTNDRCWRKGIAVNAYGLGDTCGISGGQVPERYLSKKCQLAGEGLPD